MSLNVAVALLVGAIVLAAMASWVLPAFRAYRGKRLITCPETQRPAAVDVDAVHAAATSIGGGTDLRLKDCSRWPERAGCGQDCLSQIEREPGACLVRNIAAQWYQGKTCALCGKAIPEVKWTEHRPGLLSPDRVTVSWDEVKPENLPALFATHAPVCWDCHVVSAVVREHPDLVTMRPKREHLYS
jgi:hypothetical protein